MFITLMRKHSKSILIKVVTGLIAVVFITWGVFTIKDSPGSKVAYVNGDLITGIEYQTIYRDMLNAFQQQYREYWNEGLIKAFNLKQRALDMLIDKKLIEQEAERLGLKVTEEEAADTILQYPAFQVNGTFDPERYRSLLQNNRMEASEFESRIKTQLLEQKLRDFINCFLPLTESAIKNFYTYKNEMVKIGFISLDPDDFQTDIEVSDSERQKYFEKNKEKYRVPEKIKITYLEVDSADFQDSITVTENEIKGFYELNRGSYEVPAKVRARHTLLKVSPDAPESEVKSVKEEALKILERAESGEDFSELAEKYSQGPTSAHGGDLGYFKRGEMAKPFEDLAFSLKPGDIGGPVRTQFGWHIVKVEDKNEAKIKSLSEVRDQIRARVIKDIADDMAHEKVLDLMDRMPYNIDLVEYASESGFQTKETEYFSKGGAIPGIGDDKKLRESVYSLSQGDISKAIKHNGKYYVIQVVGRKDPYIPEIKNASPELDSDLKKHLCVMAAKKRAEDYLEKLKTGTEWSTLARKNGLAIQETDYFKRDEEIPEIGYAPSISSAAFTLSADNRYPEQAFAANNKVYIIKWLDKKGIDEEKFKNEMVDFSRSPLLDKGGRLFDAWLSYLRDKAEIKVLTELG